MSFLNSGLFNLLVLGNPKSKFSSAYPQIKNVSTLRTPKSNFNPNVLILSALLILHSHFKLPGTPCELFAYSQVYAYPRLKITVIQDRQKLKQKQIQQYNNCRLS
jgi:hypothetical protein